MTPTIPDLDPPEYVKDYITLVVKYPNMVFDVKLISFCWALITATTTISRNMHILDYY
jgi:hypothetical protein